MSAFDFELDESKHAISHNLKIEKIMYVLVDKIKNEIDVELSLEALHNINAPAHLYDKYNVEDLAEQFLSDEQLKCSALKVLYRIFSRRDDPVEKNAPKPIPTHEEFREKLIKRHAKCLKNNILVAESLQFFLDTRAELYDKYNIESLVTPHLLSENSHFQSLSFRLISHIEGGRGDREIKVEKEWKEFKRIFMCKESERKPNQNGSFDIPSKKQEQGELMKNKSAEQQLLPQDGTSKNCHRRNKKEKLVLVTEPAKRQQSSASIRRNRLVADWLYNPHRQVMLSMFDYIEERENFPHEEEEDVDEIDNNNTPQIVPDFDDTIPPVNVAPEDGDLDSELEDVTSEIMRQYEPIPLAQNETVQEPVSNSNNLKRNMTDATDSPPTKQIKIETD